MPFLPFFADFKGKGKEILDETAFKQTMREVAGIFNNDDKLLKL
jgi:hypothetical protein